MDYVDVDITSLTPSCSDRCRLCAAQDLYKPLKSSDPDINGGRPVVDDVVDPAGYASFYRAYSAYQLPREVCPRSRSAACLVRECPAGAAQRSVRRAARGFYSANRPRVKRRAGAAGGRAEVGTGADPLPHHLARRSPLPTLPRPSFFSSVCRGTR